MNVWLIILLSIIAFLLVWSRLCCNNTTEQGIIKTSFSEHKNWIQKAVSKVVFSSEDFYKPNKI